MFDTVIKNSFVVDGTGQPGYMADIGIKGDRIVSLGETREKAKFSIDGHGLTLIPGIIDPHSHADLILPLPVERQAKLLHCKLAQGITTTIIGNCGLGAAPIADDDTKAILRGVNAWMTPDSVNWKWRTLGEYLTNIEENGIAINIATLIPHGPVRISAMGLRKGAPTNAEMRKMRLMIEQSMSEGALGLSTGLIYPPGMFSPTSELVELAKAISEFDGIYTSHIRGSSETLLPAVKELIEVGNEANVKVHHSHNEAVGAEHWSKIDRVLAMEEQANRGGQKVTFDMFPYTAAATMMVAIYPPWALEGGIDKLIERLRDQKLRARIARDIEKVKPSWPPWRDNGWPHNLVRAVGLSNIYIGYVASRKNKRFENLSLTELGETSGKEPFEAISDLIVEEHGHVSMLIFGISGERRQTDYLAKLAAHPLGGFCTDAEDYGHGRPHPAAYGAFASVFDLFVSKGLMTFEDAIRKMTSFPAKIFGIKDRGVIRPGAYADLILLRSSGLESKATFDRPRKLATGIDKVFIGGKIVLDSAGIKESSAGRVIRKN